MDFPSRAASRLSGMRMEALDKELILRKVVFLPTVGKQAQQQEKDILILMV